ncbi:beta-L-arabinofuranosidase domain-containing protein [Bacteroides sp.]
MHIRGLFVSTLLLMGSFLSFSFADNRHPIQRAPLCEKKFIALPLGTIRPEGWLKEQLLRQKNGLTGHLDEIYGTVMGSRNGWLGGDGDQWERGPYWIDGLLPLAYILQDGELKEKAQKWVEWAIQSQQPNGYFGPAKDYPNDIPGLQRDNSKDWWPKMVVLKILQQYYMATGDERVITTLTNYFRYQLKELPKTPLNHWTFWAQERGGDNLQVILWLYNITGEHFLLDLAELLNAQTIDWAARMNSPAFLRPWSTHCVNIAQGIKQPVIYGQLHELDKAVADVKRGLGILRNTYGLAHGLWGADEWLHNANPTQGSELCTIAEMMFSLESMVEITGDVDFADYLEKLAFNPLPSQVTDDYGARQYFQQANQIEVSDNARNFNVSYQGKAQLFGVLTGYPCCTANMHQAWPKFVQNLWYATSNGGLAALMYAASTVHTTIGDGTEVMISETTDYPFDERIRFTVSLKNKKKNVRFPLYFRMPGWCEQPKVLINGVCQSDIESHEIVCLDREWKDNDRIELEFPMHISVERGYENSAWIERGPLVYALKMNEKWEKKNPESVSEFYYEVTSDSPWNYALLEQHVYHPEKGFEVEKNKSTFVYPWNPESCPVRLKTEGTRIEEWKEYNHSAGPLPFSPYYQMETIHPEEIILIPYGCTTLRISQFPVWGRGFRND